jgi:hypothetical protein
MAWSWSCGSYGCRVRVFTKTGRPSLYVTYRDRSTGITVKECLGHADQTLAKAQAEELSDALRRANASDNAIDAPPANPLKMVAPGSDVSDPTSMIRGATTWEVLFSLYQAEKSVDKKGTGASEDARRVVLFKHYFGEKKIAGPEALDQSHITTFVRERRNGEIVVPGLNLATERKEKLNNKAVTDRTVHADLVFLMTVMHWGVARLIEGAQLLSRCRVSMPGSLNIKPVNRPVACHPDVLRIRRVADTVDPQGLFRCFARIHDALGWRVNGICHINADEVSLEPTESMPWGWVMKNQYADKEGVRQRVPLSKRAHATFRKLFRIRGIKPGDKAILFPAPRAKGKCWSRWHARDLQERAEKAAGIEPMGGSHAVRRKWVNERKHRPLKDLMMAGGWNDERSVSGYLQADEDTTYEVVSKPTRRVPRRKGLT